MNRFERINTLLGTMVSVGINRISNMSFRISELPILVLRDALVRIGKIYEENLEEKIYVAGVSSGFLKCNTAYVAMQICGDELLLAVYAREGIIKQHTTEKAVQKIEESLQKYIVGA